MALAVALVAPVVLAVVRVVVVPEASEEAVAVGSRTKKRFAFANLFYFRSAMLSPSVGLISSLKSVMPASTRMLYQVMSFLMSLL